MKRKGSYGAAAGSEGRMTLISPTVLAGLMRRQRECGRNNKRKKKKKKNNNNNNDMPTIGVPMDLAPPRLPRATWGRQ